MVAKKNNQNKKSAAKLKEFIFWHKKQRHLIVTLCFFQIAKAILYELYYNYLQSLIRVNEGYEFLTLTG